MKSWWITLILMILGLAAIFGIIIMLLPPAAEAHEWYQTKRDPVFKNPCCGDHDCSELPAEFIQAVPGGWLIVMTAEQSRLINPTSSSGINAFVPFDRIQASEDDKPHLCIYDVMRSGPQKGVICAFGLLGT